jgi:hypothetical protein
MKILCVEPKELREIAEAFALFFAGLFFVFKLFQGYFYPNLSLTVQCQRRHLPDPTKDSLVIQANLEKGDRGSIRIHHAQARITQAGRDAVIVDLVGYARSSFRTEAIGSWRRRLINWNAQSKSSPVLRVTPGEKTELSTLAEVSRSEPCIVEVAILGGERIWMGVGQWKASHISEPKA